MNAATRARKHAQEDSAAWLWQDLPDPYQDLDERHDPRRNTTGVDFYHNKQVEIREHANRPCRVDLIVLPDGGLVKRTWLAGWDPGDPAFEAKPLEAGWTIERAAAHLAAQGWTVRTWTDSAGHANARAFRCGLRCVRTGAYRNRWDARAGAAIHNTILDSRFDG